MLSPMYGLRCVPSVGFFAYSVFGVWCALGLCFGPAGALAVPPVAGVAASTPRETGGFTDPAAAAEILPLGFRIAGYLPDYHMEKFDLETTRKLTDLILFSAAVSLDGGLDMSLLENAPWEKLVRFKTNARIRLVLCIGGYERSSGFAKMTASPSSRRTFIEQVIDTCLTRRLDGVDIDWEHPATEDEQNAYADLLVELKQAMSPHGLVLSVTMAAWQQLPQPGWEAVDWLQIMSYDAKGKHATFEAARKDVLDLKHRKIPPSKLVLGVPFYGRHVKDSQKTRPFSEIAYHKGYKENSDELQEYFFNGPTTILRKTKFAIEENLGGVMVWELSQDATGERSLLRLIEVTAKAARKL